MFRIVFQAGIVSDSYVGPHTPVSDDRSRFMVYVCSLVHVEIFGSILRSNLDTLEKAIKD